MAENIPGNEEFLTEDQLQQLSQLLAATQQDVHHLQLQLQALQAGQEAHLQAMMQEASAQQAVAAKCDFPRMFGDLTNYTQKARKIHQDMNHLSKLSEKLQARVQRMQQEAARRCEAASRERARMEERERLLLARPTWQP